MVTKVNKNTTASSVPYSPVYSPGMKRSVNIQDCLSNNCLQQLQELYRIYTIIHQKVKLHNDLLTYKINLAIFTKQYKNLQKQLTKKDINIIKRFSSSEVLIRDYMRPVIKCAIENCNSELKQWLLFQINDFSKYKGITKMSKSTLKQSKSEIEKHMTVDNVQKTLIYFPSLMLQLFSLPQYDDM